MWCARGMQCVAREDFRMRHYIGVTAALVRKGFFSSSSGWRVVCLQDDISLLYFSSVTNF